MNRSSLRNKDGKADPRFLSMAPAICPLMALNHGKLDAWILLFVLPLFFVWISAIMHPFRLTKMHYLCPMTAEERIERIVSVYRFRCVFHYLVLTLCLLPVFLFRGMHPLALLYIMISNFLYVCVANPGRCEGKAGWYVFLIIACFVGSVVMFCMPADGIYSRTETIISICFYSLLLLMIPAFLILRKAMREEIEAAAYYEEESRS
ncbi:MAG: hypothetical protein K6E50_15805 [Lachnospiraceae bacterium]|nr:hypothetical protein [Lachnospiraceae bacterium]